jgi:hypothetical protein
MVSFPASMDFQAGYTLTVGSFTWTTSVATALTSSGASRMVPAPPAVQPVTAPLAAPSVTAPRSSPLVPAPVAQDSVLPSAATERMAAQAPRRQLPRYQRRHIDNSDLIELIDRQGCGLVEMLDLVETARNQLHQEPDFSGFTPVRPRQRSHVRRARAADPVNGPRWLDPNQRRAPAARNPPSLFPTRSQGVVRQRRSGRLLPRYDSSVRSMQAPRPVLLHEFIEARRLSLAPRRQ